MKKEVEQFKNEIETIKRIVNGYLSLDPLLSGFEVDSLGLKPKEEMLANHMREGIERPHFEGVAFFTRCCMNPDGTGKKLYHGSGQCPDGKVDCV